MAMSAPIDLRYCRDALLSFRAVSCCEESGLNYTCAPPQCGRGLNSYTARPSAEKTPFVDEATRAMDKLLRECFLKALDTCEDLRLPIKGTILYVQYMRPCRPAGCSLDVKTSSFKTLKKFLEQLEEEGLLQMKEGLKDPVVDQICWNHPELSGSTSHPNEAAAQSQEATWRNCRPSHLGPIMRLERLDTSLKPLWALESDKTTTATPKEPSTPSTIGEAQMLSSVTETDTPRSNPSNDPSATENECPKTVAQTSDRAAVASLLAEIAEYFELNHGKSRGDFVTQVEWSSDERWSGESALSVQAGEIVYVVEVDAQGWACCQLATGEQGWLPAAILQRQVYKAGGSFLGGAGYVRVDADDSLVVFHRDETWIYGARVLTRKLGLPSDEGGIVESGWFPSHLARLPATDEY